MGKKLMFNTTTENKILFLCSHYVVFKKNPHIKSSKVKTIMWWAVNNINQQHKQNQARPQFMSSSKASGYENFQILLKHVQYKSTQNMLSYDNNQNTIIFVIP